MVLAAGTRLGSFEVRSLLGAGGMGEVYRALDERLGREVAVKVLGAEFLSDPEQLRRFIGEARTASSLNHRNIVTIFEVGQSDGQPFLAMELIDGKTLRQHAAGGLLPLRATLELIVQVAEGLSAAHEASLVHRDLKPENLMVTRDGTVKILDFGLAKPFGAAATGDLARGLAKTSTGIVVGTASYMAPEQARGRPVDFRSDQFCLGLILYELLTGRKAFDKASAVQTLTAIIEEEPESLELLNPRVPPPLVWIVGRCLAKEPGERYAATRDLARELKQIRDNLGRLTQGVPRPATSVTARVEGAATIRTSAAAPARTATTSTPAPAPEGGGRRTARVLAAALGALVLLGGGAGLGWWMRDRTTETAATWGGDLVLGNTTQVLASRLSPDGQTLAFVTPSGGVTQVAVMKPASGDWSVLTNRPDSGSVYRVAWSKDGTRIFFDRVTDVPHGIFSVPAVGGPERLVLEDAQSPEALPDGSLLVVRTSTQGALRIHRFFPETGLVSPLGPAIVAESMGLAIRSTPDGLRSDLLGPPRRRRGGVTAEAAPHPRPGNRDLAPRHHGAPGGAPVRRSAGRTFLPRHRRRRGPLPSRLRLVRRTRGPRPPDRHDPPFEHLDGPRRQLLRLPLREHARGPPFPGVGRHPRAPRRGARSPEQPRHPLRRKCPPPGPRRRPAPAPPQERLRRDAPSRRNRRPDGPADRDAAPAAAPSSSRVPSGPPRDSSSPRSRKGASSGGFPAPRGWRRRTSRPLPTAGPSTTPTAATSGPSTSTERRRRGSSARVTASPPSRTARSSSSSATA